MRLICSAELLVHILKLNVKRMSVGGGYCCKFFTFICVFFRFVILLCIIYLLVLNMQFYNIDQDEKRQKMELDIMKLCNSMFILFLVFS